MIKPPQHPLGPAFDQARDWLNEQERALTEAQRHSYDDLKNKQALQRRQQQERLDAFRAQLEEQAKKKKQKMELVLKPPARVKDPYIERQMQNILAAEHRLENLDKTHLEERVKALEKFADERERLKEASKPGKSQIWQEAFRKATEQENNRDLPRDLSEDFGKAR